MRNNIILIIISGLLLCSNGCRTSKDFRYIEKSIRQEIQPASLDKVFRFGTGWVSSSLIKCFIRDKQAKEFMKEIKKVQIGIYEISNAEKSDSFRIPRNVEKSLAEKGYLPFMYIRSKEGDNLSFYCRFLSEKKVSLYAIILEHDGLVMFEAIGNLENILNKTIHDRRLAGVEYH